MNTRMVIILYLHASHIVGSVYRYVRCMHMLWRLYRVHIVGCVHVHAFGRMCMRPCVRARVRV